jgi:hypothetical protein
MSFHPETGKLINKTCVFELEQAMEEHGKQFHSMHEGWAVLKEEMEEVAEQYEKVKSIFDNLWNSVKQDNVYEEILEWIQLHTTFAMMELAQVWSVCDKMKKRS